MFPISDSIKSRSFPIVTLALIAVNIFVFFQELTAPSTDEVIKQYALTPSLVHFSDWHTLIPFVTSMFLHGGFLHIISNMWFLWIFGDDVEDYFGKFWYLILYFGAGIAGNVAQFYTASGASIPMLGASGAISGVLGAYYALFPNSRIKSIVTLFFFITVVEIPAVFYLFYWFIIQLFSGIASLPQSQMGGVAFWAHAVGFIVGVFFGRTLAAGKQKEYIEGEIVG